MNEPKLLEDGQIEFGIKRAGECVTEHRLDLYELKLTCEECEKQHGLQAVDGQIQATAGFLRDLAGRLTEMGIEKCSPTIAFKVWCLAAEQMAALKNDSSGIPS